jgi:hypothetical protein
MPFPKRAASRIPRWVWQPRPRRAPTPAAIKWIDRAFLVPILGVFPFILGVVVLSQIRMEVTGWTGIPKFMRSQIGLWVDVAVLASVLGFTVCLVAQYPAMLISSILVRRKLKAATAVNWMACVRCMHPLTFRRGVHRCPECGTQQDSMNTRVSWRWRARQLTLRTCWKVREERT